MDLAEALGGLATLEDLVDSASPVQLAAAQARIAEAGVQALSGLTTPAAVTEAAGHLPALATAWRHREADVLQALLRARQIRGMAAQVDALRSAIAREARRQEALYARRWAPGDGIDPEPLVMEALDTTKGGAPKRTLRNLVTILEKDSRWENRLRRDVFAYQSELDGQPISDTAEAEAAVWIDRAYGLAAGVGLLHEALATVAARHPYHPVRAYLAGLTWDGEARLDTWLGTYLGASDTPLHRAYAAMWLIQGVARVMDPGCQADHTLILVGDQGAGKSSALRVLGDPWFSDSHLDLTHMKTAYEVIQGVWVFEVPELDSMRRSEASAVKAFLTARRDRYRPAYGRNVDDRPRQVVFAGSTNEGQFLNDPTGARRFWPVRVHGGVDVDGLARARDQLWAEATVRYQRGERWHLDGDLVGEQRDAARVYELEEPRAPMVAEYLVGRNVVTTGEVLSQALHAPLTRGGAMAVATILRGLGWRRERRRQDGVRQWCWVR